MRALSFGLVLGWLALCSASCAPTAPITVIHLGKKDPPPKSGGPSSAPTSDPDDDGDRVKLRHPPADSYSGVRTGAYVVRGDADWQKMWRGATEVPAFPQTLDPVKDMLLVIANQDPTVAGMKVTRVVETGGLLTIWVRQTMLGEGCVRRPDDPTAIDAVVAPRIDKPLKFLIEDEDGPSCGEPPKAEIGCRVAAAQSWSSKMTAKTGDLIECELSSIARGKYELVDQLLTLADLPPGSKTKLTFTKGSTRATLALDQFGTYAVRAEATDEAGRKGRATALIDVLPKKTRDVLLQLAWTDLDTGDLNAPSPRVLLRVTQEGPRGQRCSAEVPVPGLCDAKTRGSYTYMRIPASRRKLPLSLLYLDERPQAGPSPCVNVWFNGERTTAVCDHDHRHAEDRWELGILDTLTGKINPPKPPPPPPDPKPAAKPAAKPVASAPPQK